MLSVVPPDQGLANPLSFPRSIEADEFPIEAISDAAEAESWRKEVSRPIYHLHKWWAQRLGTVFRAILLGAVLPGGSDVQAAVWAPSRIGDLVVFDPFMGSGTTLGEGLKLGARLIGRDINPVAYRSVRAALTPHDRDVVMSAYRQLESSVAPGIRSMYRVTLEGARRGEVLYYFWVKVVQCPHCDGGVDLFSTYVFAKHAYVRRVPLVRVICPVCGEVGECLMSDDEARCLACDQRYDPHRGTVRRHLARCTNCAEEFAVLRAVQRMQHPPAHRLYAKLVLADDGEKVYRRATDDDRWAYDRAASELSEVADAYPVVPIAPGHNTDQVLRYQYRSWDQFFNARQLLGLHKLAVGIRAVEDEPTRHLLAILFSGTLEFNNMFASYKGEGTGAVRHMYAHHILKPERMPLEANIWGTPRSSGSFSSLFRSRVLRALDYAGAPFEVRPTCSDSGVRSTRKQYDLSDPMPREAASSWEEFDANFSSLYLSCGDSSSTDLPAEVVDLIVTDPPFFDNVHYSQLADFFHVWHDRLGLPRCGDATTTRSLHEVQHAEATEFTRRVGLVLREAERVLKNDGLLVFTYHHSRKDGWASVLTALVDAGFRVTAAQPVKAEMSVATPKSRAREPIDVDVVLVCRKARVHPGSLPVALLEEAETAARQQVRRFAAAGRALGKGDLRVIVAAHVVRLLSAVPSAGEARRRLDAATPALANLVERLGRDASTSVVRPPHQRALVIEGPCS